MGCSKKAKGRSDAWAIWVMKIGGTLGLAGVVICGCTILYFGTVQGIMLSISTLGWQSTQCKIVASRARNLGTSSGDTFESDYKAEIVYEYDFSGEHYRGDCYSLTYFPAGGWENTRAIVTRYPEDSERQCYVDPDEPSQSVLDRNLTEDMLVGLLGLPFIFAPVLVLNHVLRHNKKKR
jgi:hypothetical protein